MAFYAAVRRRAPFSFEEAKMNFIELYNHIEPYLNRIAKNYSRRNLFADKEDLYQEMCVYLWCHYKKGVPEGVNNSYILQGCRFHILNYLRVKKEKALFLSLEEPIDEKGTALKDVLPEPQEPLERKVERGLVFEKIRNNGFSVKEKEALALLLQGYTVREAAKKMGISHVMIVKYKKRIIKKWHRKGYQR
jgi:RNA polymerase sigma factor (sigma-70 family)